MTLGGDFAGGVLLGLLAVIAVAGFAAALLKLREERSVEHEGVVYAMRRNGRIEDPDGRIVEDEDLRAILTDKGARFAWAWVFPTEGYKDAGDGSGKLRPRINWSGGGGHCPPNVDRGDH